MKDGTIDMPRDRSCAHLAEEKELEFRTAPFGIIGLERALPLYAKALVEPGAYHLDVLIDLMTLRRPHRPARQRHTPEGKDADVTIIDPNHKWTIDCSKFTSKSRNCPFQGWAVNCRAVMTIVGGDVNGNLGS